MTHPALPRIESGLVAIQSSLLAGDLEAMHARLVDVLDVLDALEEITRSRLIPKQQRPAAPWAATGASTACLPSEVPCLVLDGDRLRQAYPSGATALSNTPQCFRRELLLDVTRTASAQGWTSQSTVQLVLRAGLAVVSVPGEKLAIKLTTPEDWVLAQALHAQLSR